MKKLFLGLWLAACSSCTADVPSQPHVPDVGRTTQVSNKQWCSHYGGDQPCWVIPGDKKAPKHVLINGNPVTDGSWPQVVRIQTNGAGCTATLVGPKVIITAAHCGRNGAKGQFAYKNKSYSFTVERSGIYPGKDHDIAVGIMTEEITDIVPVSVGDYQLMDGMDIRLLGYGCTKPGGSGGNDGVLREGMTKIVDWAGYDFVSKMAGGAALCYGDSGGPGLHQTGGQWYIVGVNSKGNIQDTNYNARLDMAESQQFLTRIVQQHSVDICGVNKDCGTTPPPGKQFVLDGTAAKYEVTLKVDVDADYAKTNLGYLDLYLDSQKDEGGGGSAFKPPACP